MEIRMADCPLGAKCEEVKTVEGKPVLFRCPWYAKVQGIEMNTGKEVDEWACSIAWMPVLMINAANESRKGVAATESLRNIVAGAGATPTRNQPPRGAGELLTLDEFLLLRQSKNEGG